MNKRTSALLLALILLLSAAVRLWGITYGLPCSYCRPDEDRLISTAVKLSLRDPNPRYFIWPSLFFYLTRGAIEAAETGRALFRGVSHVSGAAAAETIPPGFHLALRLAFCVLGLLTVFTLYRLGERMFSAPAGLIAALFLGFSFLHGRDSRFAMLDIPAALFAVAAVLRAWSVFVRGRLRDYLLCGLFCGLAAATKYYAAVAVFPLLAAHFSRPRPRSPGRLLAAISLAALFFAASSPYLWLEPRASAREITEGILASQFVSGFHLLPRLVTSRGWLYHLVFSLRYGLGLPLELLALAGAAYGTVRALRGRVAFRLLLAVVFPFYALLAFQKSCFIRYTTLLLPFLCLLAAAILADAFERLKVSGVLLAIAALVIIAEPADRLLRLDALLSRPDTRALASDWMHENLPSTTPLLFLHPLIFGRPPAASFYPNRLALPEGVTAQQALEAIREIAHRGWFFILDEYPLDYSYAPPELRGMVSREAKTVFTVDPFVPASRPAIFDPFDAFYVPIDGFEGVRLPGPAIRIYWIE